MIGFSEKSVKTAAWLFFGLLFLVYMVNADRVYHVLNDKSYAVKLLVDFPLYAKGDLNYQFPFGMTIISNKFEEKFLLSGVLSTVNNKSGRAKVRVFFRSSDALYELIENRVSFWASSTKNGVNFFASTTGLENGVYTMGVHLTDDAGERFVWLNSFFEKTTGGPVEYLARPVALAPTMVSKDLKFSIEQIEKTSKEFILKGWVVLENVEMNDFNAYIMIKDSKNIVKTFYMPFFTRMDIASLYDDTRAANSGFLIKFPQGEFAAGKHVIKVIIKSRKTGEVIESAQAETRNF